MFSYRLNLVLMFFTFPFLRRPIFHRRLQFDKKFNQFRRGEWGRYAFDKRGQTLLHLAIIENRLEPFKDLIASGFSKKRLNAWGMTPADLARFLGRKSFLSLLEPKKPPSLITIHRNRNGQKYEIPIEEFEEKLKIEYIESLEFNYPDDLTWAVDKSTKQLRKQSIRKMNRWTLALHQKSILSSRCDHVYIRYIDHAVGYGVFANRSLPALTYVGEYTGSVKRRSVKRIDSNDYVFGYMAGSKSTPFVIDAAKKGNFTRFINHSCAPNMSSRWVVLNGVTRIIIFTNRSVPEGGQLTYDYGKYYWRRRAVPFLF